jgi:hypothetical protein
VRDEAGGVIRTKAATSSRQSVSLTFADGDVGAVIGGTQAPKPKPKLNKRKSAKRPTQKEGDKKQASLF